MRTILRKGPPPAGGGPGPRPLRAPLHGTATLPQAPLEHAATLLKFLVADRLDVVLEAEGRGHPRPVDNAHIESFNGRLRDGCLNSRWFESIDDARQTLQA